MGTFSETERRILTYWQSIKAFETAMQLSEGKDEFSFYDGPPFATGLPHYGHILSGTIKDTVTRFFYQQGHHVVRRFGWDCHGLPIEYEIDKMYGIKTTQDVERVGVAAYNGYCRSIVTKYTQEWEETVNRMGRWIDFQNGYKTMDFSFMESVWSVFKELHSKGLVYKGYRVMPYSTACRTPMSNFEANQNYKEATDLAATVRLELLAPLKVGEQTFAQTSLLIWTTTPWTLPSNLAALVNPEMDYAVIADKEEGTYGVVGLFSVGKRPILAQLKGQDLLGLEYSPPFAFFETLRTSGFFKVYGASYVAEGAGTGVVHCAPGFGEEDYMALVAAGLLTENQEVPCPINDAGLFTAEIEPYAGQYVKDTDSQIIKDLKAKGRLYASGSIVHSYPFCWRSDTPLIYRAIPSWFVRVKQHTDELVKENQRINWAPAAVGTGKFGLWLAHARDWSISRNRYWGTPIPIWVRTDVADPKPEDYLCIGSAAELESLSGTKVTDLHKDKVDEIIISHNGHQYKRTPEVLDCWFESGSVPYAQIHYPFENKERFEKTFPADFIAEGLDQTRGWFYTLHVLAVLLHRRPAFKNVMVTGLVLAADGKKMSKRLKNYPDPSQVMDTHGADAMRLYMISSPVVKAENLRFTEQGVAGMLRDLLIPWENCLRFLLTTGGSVSTSTGCEIEDIALEVAGISISEQEDGLLLDLWIVKELKEFAQFIEAEGRAYRVQGIVARAVAFLGDLSRWYIRLSRERLRGTEMPVLAFVLRIFSVFMAPFAPFFSERCFLALVKPGTVDDLPQLPPTNSSSLTANPSVHFIMHQDAQHEITEMIKTLAKRMSKGADTVLEDLREVKSVVEAVRIIREKNGLSLKMPICEVSVVGSTHSTVLANVLAKECNAMSVCFRNLSDYTWDESITPDFKRIGALHTGKEVQQRASLIRANHQDTKTISQLMTTGKVELSGLTITREEVIYRREAKGLPANIEGLAASDTVYALVDKTQNEATKDLWIRREIKSAVQKLRKRAGLQISDLATLFVQGTDPAMVTCDPNTQLTSTQLEGTTETLEIAGQTIKLTLATHKD
ncbi:isoleucyl-tRNA synthetase [Nematocida homosporus]|uniref:isoleucyl-tRNA synthetase n=1 Tax=Nematocida homosporus TaxID=1912981 RepID=UPI00221F3112|nr:isoleucyl-tRNA synthetase [Nematocida homosporus]KAI5184789.1 isoleucyl-tRNA synthetase [Nematocida homosporus]